MTRTVLGAREILLAQRNIRRYLPASPLVRSENLSRRINGEVWLKLENRQPTGSFKVRGALAKLSSLGDYGRGVVTGSAGNHGLGVAFAAANLGIDAVTIFVPETAPDTKISRLREFGVDLRLAGQTYDDAHQEAIQFSKANNVPYIPAYDDEQIIAGQGTIGLEIMGQCPDVEMVFVPVGGGGLIAGTAVALKELSPAVRVVGVQAAASPSAYLSLKDGTPYDPYDHEPTIADGLAGGFGAKPFFIARSLIEQVLLFDEYTLRRCIYNLLDQERVLAEASGAVAIAPLLDPKEDVIGKRAVCVISGGNLETRLLKDILNEFSEDKSD
jgi:threonine dehydratase